MRFTRFILLATATAGFSVSAFAQGAPAQKVVTLDLAQSLAQEAMTTCRANGYKVTVLVVDALNMPKAMLRDDGATASSTEVAKMKATSVMLYNRPSGPPANLAPGAPVPAVTIQ